jgi:signal transduction histidine kinase
MDGRFALVRRFMTENTDSNVADILIVDDDPANLLAMEAALGDLGGRVVRAHSGSEALRLLLDRDFALIMLDVNMPALGGFETARLIRERKRSRHTPIIFVTAYGRDEQDILAAYKLGAVDFLFKPIVAEIVHAKAGVFVDLQRRTEEVARQAQQLREHEQREHERALAEQQRRWDEESLRRERDGLAEADRRKDEFIAMLGHELRNPLASIVTGLEILGRRLSNESSIDVAVHRTHARINRQIGHLTRLVDDLVDIARINTNKIELRVQPVAIQDIVDQAVNMCRPLIDDRGHVLTVDLPAAPITLVADAVRMTQVFANLLTNAARYTEPGGKIQVSCRQSDDNLEISVKDNGRGIEPTLLPRIFDVFVQAKKPGDVGLGLGLAIVKRLVAMHEGSVTVSSDGLGNGSEFVVRLPLPLALPAVAASVSPPSEASPEPSEVPPLSIVLVEDNADLREGMKELLEDMGHSVEAAENGEDGVELILRRRPAVAFVDIGLPLLDGCGVAARVRAELGREGVLMVAMSGFGQASDRQRSEEAGFDTHLVKPAEVETLRKILSLEGKMHGQRAGQ